MIAAVFILIYLLGAFVAYGFYLGTTQASYPWLIEDYWMADIKIARWCAFFSWFAVIVVLAAYTDPLDKYGFRLIPKKTNN